MGGKFESYKYSWIEWKKHKLQRMRPLAKLSFQTVRSIEEIIRTEHEEMMENLLIWQKENQNQNIVQ